MSNRLVIVGAGGHGKVVADNALKNGYTDIVFVDDCAAGACMGYLILGTTAEMEKLNDGRTDFVIGIGNNEARKRIAQKYDVHWVRLIHPSAQVGIQTAIGEGTVIMAGAIVNAGAKIGMHCIINSGAIVEHDNVIGNYVHLSPRATLGGAVQIGEQTHIGIGATVRNNTTVCKGCVIGAGAVVVKSITEQATYIGVPAEKMSSDPLKKAEIPHKKGPPV